MSTLEIFMCIYEYEYIDINYLQIHTFMHQLTVFSILIHHQLYLFMSMYMSLNLISKQIIKGKNINIHIFICMYAPA
jgi:hypothetical protein